MLKTEICVDLNDHRKFDELIGMLGIRLIESHFFPGQLKSLLCVDKSCTVIYLDDRMSEIEKKTCILLQLARFLHYQGILAANPEECAEHWIACGYLCLSNYEQP